MAVLVNYDRQIAKGDQDGPTPYWTRRAHEDKHFIEYNDKYHFAFLQRLPTNLIYRDIHERHMPARQHRRRLPRHTDMGMTLKYYAILHQALVCAVYGRFIRFFSTSSAATITTFLMDLFFLADYYCVQEEAMSAIIYALYDQVDVWEDVKDQRAFYVWAAHYFKHPELLLEAMRHAAGRNELAYFTRFTNWIYESRFEIPAEHHALAAYAHTSLLHHVEQLHWGLLRCIREWKMYKVEYAAERLVLAHHKRPAAITTLSKLRQWTCTLTSELRSWLRGEPKTDHEYWTSLIRVAGSVVHQCLLRRFSLRCIEYDKQNNVPDRDEASSYGLLYTACQDRIFDIWDPEHFTKIACKLGINLDHLHQASHPVLEELQRWSDRSPLFHTCEGNGHCPNSPNGDFPSCAVCDMAWCDCSSEDEDEDEPCPHEVYDERFPYILSHRQLRAMYEPDDIFTYLDFRADELRDCSFHTWDQTLSYYEAVPCTPASPDLLLTVDWVRRGMTKAYVPP